MNITFIGVGSAFSKQNYNSGAIVECPENIPYGTTGCAELGESIKFRQRRLMIDCGRTAPEALLALGLTWHDIDSLFLTHAHSDHISGVEEFAFSRMFIPPVHKPELIGPRELLEDYWDYSLRGGLGTGAGGKRMYLDDYFDIRHTDGDFNIGDTSFHMVKLMHIMPSYGLVIRTPTSPTTTHTVFYTGDTTLDRDLVKHWQEADTIFQDCETSSYMSRVHVHYSQLVDLAPEIKAKMWLYHYQDGVLPDCKAAGFAGFVEKGQTFTF